MFEVEVKEIIKSTNTGRKGFLLIVELIKNDCTLTQGDLLYLKEDNRIKITVKSLEMINYGVGQEKLKHFGLLTVVSEETANALKGKR
ncbi:hypothetical protein QNH20_10010 [Neobacillus sp. WH10]|uniref:hypothetical protein n=1 Tax=Neobacillus sp. WH10 TaxID=3047873 RepID=UPI0024C0F78E|nr:hypothetical protein [Neobacillus sp. WH10]WHY79443.1 hypothetical protein QNH20_10010 [Neobacillus sp. WH10]